MSRLLPLATCLLPILALPAAAQLAGSAPAPKSPAAPATQAAPAATTFVDLTGDGRLDKLLRATDGSLSVAVNVGGGSFDAVRQELPSVATSNPLLSDLDGDGNVDLYLVTSGGNVALLGDGAGGLREATSALGLDDGALGLSAERVDLDGDGLDEVLLHNATGDVLFWAQPSWASTTFARDPGTPESVPSGAAVTMTTLVSLLAGVAVDESGVGNDVTVSVGIDAAGQPVFSMAPADAPDAPEMGAGPGSGQDLLDAGGQLGDLDARPGDVTGTPAPELSIPAQLLDELHALFVNDDGNEVDSADVIDYSLVGADVSTSSGDVAHMGGDVGIGTTSPLANLHVVGEDAHGRLMVSASGSGSNAILLMQADEDASAGMKVMYSGSQDMLAVIGTEDDEATTYGPHLTVDRVDGLVGIQTQTPDAMLGIQDTAAADTLLRGFNDAGETVLFVSDNGRTGFLTDDPDASVGAKAMDGFNTIFRGKDVNDATVYRVFDDGRTGIGTDAPNAALGVQQVPSTTTLMRAMDDTGSTVFQIFDDGRTGIGTDNPDAGLAVHESSTSSTILRARNIGGTTVARVFNDGRAGFGTASPNAALGVQEVPSTTTLFRAMDANGDTVVRITNLGRVICGALEITGGADLVEPFEASETCEPGSVVVLDADAPGSVKLARGAYDRAVAGVVSGAGGVQAGLMLSQEGVVEGDTSVALTGRVYVKASAENGPIGVGDLLVSSELPGHAMRADDADRSFGAVIGKAMSELESDTGLVLVLVNLQ